MTLFDAQSPKIIWMIGVYWPLESSDWFDVVHLRRLKCADHLKPLGPLRRQFALLAQDRLTGVIGRSLLLHL